jgi:hypothetical protein
LFKFPVQTARARLDVVYVLRLHEFLSFDPMSTLSLWCNYWLRGVQLWACISAHRGLGGALMISVLSSYRILLVVRLVCFRCLTLSVCSFWPRLRQFSLSKLLLVFYMQIFDIKVITCLWRNPLAQEPGKAPNFGKQDVFVAW